MMEVGHAGQNIFLQAAAKAQGKKEKGRKKLRPNEAAEKGEQIWLDYRCLIW
jgi:hypothetical protein